VLVIQCKGAERMTLKISKGKFELSITPRVLMSSIGLLSTLVGVALRF